VSSIEKDQLASIQHPSLLVYQKRLREDPERQNLESMLKLRKEMDCLDLAPLPCFYMEQLAMLGIRPHINLQEYMCPHEHLDPIYSDIYPKKPCRDIVLEEEWEVIERKSAIRPERLLVKSPSCAFKHLLLATTLLPKPIVEYILEKVPAVQEDQRKKTNNGFRKGMGLRGVLDLPEKVPREKKVEGC
jgi:hypothetical protein